MPCNNLLYKLRVESSLYLSYGVAECMKGIDNPLSFLSETTIDRLSSFKISAVNLNFLYFFSGYRALLIAFISYKYLAKYIDNSLHSRMMRAARTGRGRRSQAAACHVAMHQSRLPLAMLVFLQYFFKQLNTIIKQLSALLMQLDKLQSTKRV